MTGLLLAMVLQVLATHPAGSPDGKLLTMKEAVMGIGSPLGANAYHWEGDHELVKGFGKRTGPRKYILPSEDKDGIVIGETVSRNEFGINGGVFPSPSGALLAVYRKDESAVTQFPLLDITTRTGSLVPIRYPMIGMASEHISLLICDTLGNVRATIVPTEFTDERYLTCVTWGPDEKYIFIQVLDREQHHMVLNQYRADDGTYVRTILSEENPAWVEPREPLHFIKGRYEFLYETDNRHGHHNLYLCDTLGNIRVLPTATADIQYIDNDGRWVYYTSSEVSPIQNHLFRMDLGKFKSVKKARFSKPQRLTWEEGWHNVRLSPDMTRFLDSWSSFNVPGKVAVRSTDGKKSELLFEASDPLEEYACCEMELGTVPSADGKFLNYYRLYKPLGFDPSKKYPVVVYVYGGPHSQMVQDRWLGGVRLWEMLMAQKGYVVYVQDNRGTSNRGAEFEKAINRNCGQAEMADQVAGLRELMKQPWVDTDRIGVHGWSYGGFMTISLMTNYPEIFKVGVAGGPVIDWKWYEVMYGERYMDTPETNPEGFKKTSLINKAADLKGKLLICQGAIDNTVVWEHSLSFVQKCIEEGVQLDYFPYPLSEHNVRGKWRVHLMDKVTDYFDLYL
ncbi:MAG: prolyl oligopeptidase family serine peptidase [Bacteroidales bacterium]|nr:prolyl oligopeptidase family serine peptidase [Bacteroidales bacterium]